MGDVAGHGHLLQQLHAGGRVGAAATERGGGGREGGQSLDAHREISIILTCGGKEKHIKYLDELEYFLCAPRQQVSIMSCDALLWLLVLMKWKFFNGHLNLADATSAPRWTLPVTPFLDAVETDGAVGSEQDDHVPEDVEQQSV